ncbi:MAG: tetratricopeptide repeat protein, partial [Deltaproteobacteria bacterium]
DAPPSAPAAPSLDDIGLDAPAAAPPPPGGGVVTFSTPTAPADDVPAAPRLSLSESLASAPPASTDELDLAMDPARAPRRSDVVARVDEAALGEAAPVRKRPMSRARKLAVAAAAVVAVLGAGGFYLYQRHAAEQARAADIARSIATARRALAEDRWLDAAAAAQRALKTDPKHPAALGLAAQAYFAAAIDRGTDAAKLVAEGEAVFRKISEAAARGPEVDAAAGLRALTERNPTEAIAKLSAAAERDRRDPNLPLYLGWAYAQAGDFAKAADAFDHALRKIPKRVPALYGLGLAHIELGNTDAARDALLAVTEIDPAHIGARVGLAQLVEVDRFDAREARYLEILNDPNIAKADPRAVARAWALAGDEALRAGRVDEAVGRYTKALELDPDNVTAVIGEGKAALAQGRYEVARERLKAALSARPDNIDAMVAYAEASLALRDWDAAFDSIESALKRNPKNWRAQYVYGKILAAFPDAEEGAAEEVLRAAVAIAPPGEIAPTVELSKLLVAKGRGQEALAVLRPVEAAAETDAALAVALGVAYLNTGDAARAEQWFRKALDLRPADVEAQLQLGMALGAQEKFDEALAILEKAWEADNTREDVGVRLATLYERAGMDDKAAEIYDALVARPGASLNARGRAGRFYARTGRIDKAVSLGESILAENERDAAGHYLRGEGLYAQGKYAEAQSEFRDATLIDPQAQYYEALGRAMEKQGLLADALRAYERAMGLDGKYLAPRVGRVRIHVSRRQYQEALDEANAALAIAPDDPDLHFYRGESLYEMGRARDAVDAYKRAVGGRPDFAYAYYRMGKAYVDLDKPRDAVAALAKATRLAEGSEAAWLADAHYYLATAARTAGDRGTAIRAFRAFLDMSPDDARARDARKLLLRLEAGGR